MEAYKNQSISELKILLKRVQMEEKEFQDPELSDVLTDLKNEEEAIKKLIALKGGSDLK